MSKDLLIRPEIGTTTTSAQPWQPILDGAMREQALETIRAIADAFRDWPTEIVGVGTGASGLAVCFAYLAEGLEEPEHEETARSFLEQAMVLAEKEPMLPSLYHGLAGVGWAATHLRNRLHWPELEATAADIDETLLDYLRQPVWQEDYGLMSGLVGLGVYALERLTPGADATGLAGVECLERIVKLEDRIVPGCGTMPLGWGVAHGNSVKAATCGCGSGGGISVE